MNEDIPMRQQLNDTNSSKTYWGTLLSSTKGSFPYNICEGLNHPTCVTDDYHHGYLPILIATISLLSIDETSQNETY